MSYEKVLVAKCHQFRMLSAVQRRMWLLHYLDLMQTASKRISSLLGSVKLAVGAKQSSLLDRPLRAQSGELSVLSMAYIALKRSDAHVQRTTK